MTKWVISYNLVMDKEKKGEKTMPDFSSLNETTIEVEVVTLSGVSKVEATEGMTVKEFKEANGLVGKKIIDEDSNLLRDTDTIESGMQLYVSTPKQNG